MDKKMDEMADGYRKTVYSTKKSGYNEVQHLDIEAYHIWYEIPAGSLLPFRGNIWRYTEIT